MSLIQLEKNKPVITTFKIADGVNIEHNSILKLVRKYEKELNSITRFEIQLLKNIKGRPTEYAFLDEEQTTFLITLMRNSKIVVEFKLKLTKEFYRIKKVLAETMIRQKNEAWIEQREQGKLSRKEETDIIKKFVEYATNQGSTQANRYYLNISKMENTALFFLEQKFKNVRDALTGQQLQIIAVADIAVAQALKYGMEKEMNYKDIFLLAKDRIDKMSNIIPKTIVPMTEKINILT